MGTKVHCKSHTPGYYSMTDMNEDSNSSSWSPYYGDKNLLNGQYYNGMLQKTVRDEYTGYEKDVLRQKMIEHDMIFKNQVYELHRLYKVQREMMEEAKRKELYKQQRSIETSSSSSFLPSQIPSDEVRKWQSPSFPIANSGCARPSIMGSEVIDSPSSWMKGHNNPVDPVSYQNRCDPKDSAFLDSRPSKVRKTLFDLQIPADEYIVTEEDEQFRDIKMSDTSVYPPEGNHRLALGSSINKYLGGGKTSDIRDTSSGSCMKRSHLLADLNEPIQVEEGNSPKSVKFSGRSVHEDIRGLDMSAKPKSQFVDLTQDFFQKSQCGSSNGNVSNLSETNKGARRGWLSYMYEGGNCGIDANSIPKFHQSEKLPSTSQQTSFMTGKPKQCQGILPPDSRMDGPWTERNRSNEFSNRSLDHSIYNQPDSVATSHISNPYPWYNSSDAANSWSRTVTSWGKPNPSLTQKLTSLHSRPSAVLSETSSREININPSLNPGFGSKLPTQNGFCQGSSLVSKEPSATLSSFGYNNNNNNNNNNLKRNEIDIAASSHLTSHASKNVFRASDAVDSKSGKDLDLNVVLSSDSLNEEPPSPDIEILDGKRKFKDHSTALSWLREKPVNNNVSTTRKDVESGLLQPSCNPLLIGETVKDLNPLSIQNVSAALSGCDVRVKREPDCVSNGKLLGFPIFGKIGSSKNDSASTSASIQSYHPDGINTKNKGKHRGFDMNIACDSMDTEFDKPVAAEAILPGKVKDTKCNNFRNIDLNSCVSEDEDILDSSVASTSGKVKIAFEIDLEAPAVLETVEALSPTKEQKQHEVSLQSPPEETENQQEQVVRSAAEAIVAISYSQDPHLDPSELPDPLKWFADVIFSSADEVEMRLHKDYESRNGREIETPRELDEYEAMTLQLTETPKEDYMPEPFVPEIINLEDVGTAPLPGRPRRGPARRGRMRKDFQRDILPGLVSLSRHEVTEDLQTFGGLMRATGHQWNGGMTRRNGTRSGAARGRRRCVVEPPPAVVVAPVCNPPMQNFNSIQLGVEDRSLAGWGKTTRRARGQRSAAGNNLAVSIT